MNHPRTGKLIPLTEMKRGQHGFVRELHGGTNFAQKLSSLGIRPGKKISKVSAMLLGGPIVISINNRHVAVGFGMAKKIMVEVE